MSNPAKKSEYLHSAPPIIIDENDPDEIDRELFGDSPPEQTSINLKIPSPPQSDLVKNILRKAKLWTLGTIILDKDPEPEVDAPAIVEFKTAVHNIIATTYLAPAWEYFTQPLNKKSRTDLEHIHGFAIQYCRELGNYKYQAYLNLQTVNDLLDAIESGDWLSTEGLTAMDLNLCLILHLPLK